MVEVWVAFEAWRGEEGSVQLSVGQSCRSVGCQVFKGGVFRGKVDGAAGREATFTAKTFNIFHKVLLILISILKICKVEIS